MLRRTDNPDDAADVIGEVFLTAWRRLEDMPAGEHARLWLYGVARRCWPTTIEASEGADRRPRPDLAAAYRPPEFTGERSQIAAALRRLPDAERELRVRLAADLGDDDARRHLERWLARLRERADAGDDHARQVLAEWPDRP